MERQTLFVEIIMYEAHGYCIRIISTVEKIIHSDRFELVAQYLFLQ